jgi:hypothetical protein
MHPAAPELATSVKLERADMTKQPMPAFNAPSQIKEA